MYILHGAISGVITVVVVECEVIVDLYRLTLTQFINYYIRKRKSVATTLHLTKKDKNNQVVLQKLIQWQDPLLGILYEKFNLFERKKVNRTVCVCAARWVSPGTFVGFYHLDVMGPCKA